MWVWAQNVQRYGAEKVAETCRRAGVTDLFFLTKGLAGTTAFHSAFAPSMSDRDLLREMISAAHARGMRVHAWFASSCDAHFKQLNPHSGRCHYTRGKDRELISLSDEGYRRYMEKIVAEVCNHYEIDGLHLDYIRYNHLLYGWAEEDLKRYEASGADIAHLREMTERRFYGEKREETLLFDAYRAGDETARAFAWVRRCDVVRFAQSLIESARSGRSGICVSAALMPEGAYDDTAFADLHYGQSYQDAAKLYDFALPMAYSHAYGKDSQWVKAVAEGSLKRGVKTVMGLHAYEGGTGPMLAADLLALQDAPVQGVCLFREGACVLARTQGRKLWLFNALDEEITAVEGMDGKEKVRFSQPLAPGEEREFALPFEAKELRVFAGEKERSVYLAHTC